MADESRFKKTVKFGDLLKHTPEGELSLFGLPGFFYAVYIDAYNQRLLEKMVGEKKTRSILYSQGEFQTIQAFHLITSKFGIDRKIQDKAKLLEYHYGQAEFVGLGRWKIATADFVNNCFIVHCVSPIAKEYKRLFGIQQKPIDHKFCGMANASPEILTGQKMFTIETRCVAAGAPYCEFVTRSIDAWKKEGKLDFQDYEKPPALEELGIKKSIAGLITGV